MGDLETAIRQFILAHHLPGERPENLADTTPLQTSGILDSLAVLGLATFLERRCGVEFTTFDTTPDQFDTIADIARLVDAKQRAVRA